MSNGYCETLIRNFDAGFLYWKIKDDSAIEEYERLKKEQEESDKDGHNMNEIQRRMEEKSKEVFSFAKKNIILPVKDLRYRYTGTLSDSLMSRKLRLLSKELGDNGAFRTVKNNDGTETDYTDVIINLQFKSDIMIKDEGKAKRAYNPDTHQIEDLPAKEVKRLISKKKLRQMAYRDGIMINGIRYVNFQRTSSKARTGNVLFIDERYFGAMDEWQNMGIPFRKMVRSKYGKNSNLFEGADIVSTRSYQSLTSSSIIGTLEIDPDSILLIDDVSGEYTMPCNVVKSVPDEEGKGRHLKAERQDYTQRTDLWDGQSLLDRSVFERGAYFDRKRKKSHNYSEKGFMLLRNHFFKTAGFNTNLQDYYKERFQGVEHPQILDRFGEAFDPGKVLMVTTKNSVKILKFADVICAYEIEDDKKERLKELEEPIMKLRAELDGHKKNVSVAKRKLTILKKNKDATKADIAKAADLLKEAEKTYEDNAGRIEKEITELMKPVKIERERLVWRWYRDELKSQKQEFGVCKYEKVSKFGDRQQLWYQVIGSLNLDKEKLWKIAEQQIKEVNLMKKHPAFFKHYLNSKETKRAGEAMMLALLSVNDDVSRTKWYTDYRRSQISSILKKLYRGKVQLEDSDFCVLVGNPYEMLRASAGDDIADSILKDWECWCKRYKDGEELYGFRSPHICSGNCALLNNTYRDEWRWFNFTERIVAVNFWGKGAFLSPRWEGCDVDSDSAYIGNDPTILEAVRETKDFLIPINSLEPEPKILEYTDENMAKVDGQLCNDFIGKVCNYARDLQGFYWHLYNTGSKENKEKYLPMIYDDIYILETLSNIAIDNAKRRYDVNIASEIRRLKDRPYLDSEGAIIKNETILKKKERYKRSLSEKTIRKYERLVEQRNEATDPSEVAKKNEEIDKLLKKEDTHFMRPDFTKNLRRTPKRKGKKFQSEEERDLHRQKQIAYAQEQKEIKEKTYHKLQSPMDLLADVVKDEVDRCDRTNYITFVEILNRLPKGTKADYNRVEAMEKVCLDGISQMNALQRRYDGMDLSFEEMYEEKNNLEKNIVHSLRYVDDNMETERTVTEWDVHKLLRDLYDTHPKRDKHGKIEKDEEGKKIIVDKRDKRFMGHCGKGRKKKSVAGIVVQWVYAAFPDAFIKAIKQNTGTVSTVVKVGADNENPKSVKSLKDIRRLSNGRTYTLYGEDYEIVTEPCRSGTMQI